MSLKEPKRVKAVESSQSGGTRQLSFGQTAWRPCAPTGATKLLLMMKYATAPAYFLINDCLSLALW